MIKSMKNVVLAICLVAASSTSTVQAVNVQALAGGALATGGGVAFVLGGGKALVESIMNDFYQMDVPAESRTQPALLNRLIVGGAAAVVAGIVVLARS